MREATPSTTALAVSLMRAVHSRTAALPLIDDRWGEELIPDSIIEAIGQSLFAASGKKLDEATPPDMDAVLRASPALGNVVLRSRYTEDALREAVARGVSQYVLIGAGLDSYALRIPTEAKHVQIYEVDHPATQAFKTQRLAECGVSLTESVHFLPADLSEQALGRVLQDSPFDTSQPAFFSLLGVTMYLSPEANRVTMREIASCSAPGSELVFTYIDQAIFSAPVETANASFAAMQGQVASQGEPFISGFDPESLGRNLESAGLRLDEDLSDIELIARYDPQGLNGLDCAHQSRIARAGVADITP
jgi:methyltransferase (TIGR00027 family)